jgi:hypothetical protein
LIRPSNGSGRRNEIDRLDGYPEMRGQSSDARISQSG